MRKPRLLLLALIFGLLAALPATAGASGASLIQDCKYGQLKAHYSQQDFRDALASLPKDFDNYSDCRDQIERLQQKNLLAAKSGSSGSSSNQPSTASVLAPAAAAASGGGGSSGSGGSSSGGSGTQGSSTSSHPAAPAPIEIAGKTVSVTGSALPSIGSGVNVPLPIIAVAIVVALFALIPIMRWASKRFSPSTAGGE